MAGIHINGNRLRNDVSKHVAEAVFFCVSVRRISSMSLTTDVDSVEHDGKIAEERYDECGRHVKHIGAPCHQECTDGTSDGGHHHER